MNKEPALCSLVNNESTLHKEAIGNKEYDDEEDDGANILVNKEAALCKEEMKEIVSKKLCNQGYEDLWKSFT